MSASKLSGQVQEAIRHLYPDLENLPKLMTIVAEKYADEMALRVFEDTRERAAKIAADAIAPNRRDIADAIRAMQLEVIIEAIRAMQPEA